MKRIHIKVAGIINLFTALLHLIGGQIELVNPLLESNISTQQKGELTGAWHIVTILLFFTSYRILRAGFKGLKNAEELKSIAFIYILSGLPFIFVSFWFEVFAAQWILLIPIGILLLFGLKKQLNK